MIARAYATTPSHDLYQRAGDAAERQMAHYLDRAFGQDPQVQVFHNLRAVLGQDVAQIDHLLLHPHGAVIIESKSVTSQVHINRRGEWSRLWNGRLTGMSSPLLQGERQGALLARLLDRHQGDLLGKMLGLVQKRFGTFQIAVLVAISDRGVIVSAQDLPDVCKADQVPQRAQAVMRRQAQRSGLLGLARSEPGISLSAEEQARVTRFLTRQHRDRPRRSAEPRPAGTERRSASIAPVPRQEPAHLQLPAPGRAGRRHLPARAPAPGEGEPRGGARTPATPAQICRHCGSTRLSLKSGPYSPYFNCCTCGGNTRAEATCPTCRGRATIRQDPGETRFRASCPACRSSWPFTAPVG